MFPLRNTSPHQQKALSNVAVRHTEQHILYVLAIKCKISYEMINVSYNIPIVDISCRFLVVNPEDGREQRVSCTSSCLNILSLSQLLEAFCAPCCQILAYPAV